MSYLGSAESERALHARRVRAQQAALERERALEADWLADERRAAFHHYLSVQNANIASILSSEYNSTVSSTRFRQAVIAESTELSDLQAALRAAQVARDLEIQRQQHMVEQQQREQQRLRDAELFEQAEQAAAREAAREAALRDQASRHEASVLRNQIREQTIEREMAEMQQREAEEKAVSEILSRIQAEEQSAAQATHEKIKRQQRDIADFLAQREKFKIDRTVQKQQELEQLVQTWAEEDARAAAAAAAAAKRATARDQLYARLAAQISSANKDRDELEKLRIELADAEAEAEERERVEQMLRARVQAAGELRAAYARHLEQVAQREAEAEAEAEVWRRQITQEWEQEQVRQQVGAVEAAKRRQVFRQQMEAELQRRREQRHREQEEELSLERAALKLDDERQRIVAEERARLIRENAAALIRFLPRGILSDSKDLELLPANVRQDFYRMRRVHELTNNFGMDEKTAENTVRQEEAAYGTWEARYKAQENTAPSRSGRVRGGTSRDFPF